VENTKTEGRDTLSQHAPNRRVDDVGEGCLSRSELPRADSARKNRRDTSFERRTGRHVRDAGGPVILQTPMRAISDREEYRIENKTQPPMAYFHQNGSFVFALPDGAELSQVSAAGASGMQWCRTIR